jgi:hypothetical protein
MVDKPSVKIWSIQHGPFHKSDLEDPSNVPDDLEYFIVAKAEVGGEIEDLEFWFQTFDDVQVLVKHFQTKIEPIEVNY